ncbi:class I SAM-dependent methyltransferase [Stenotrophomonas koreensis]|uniref:class I SAM-dependent methyltransferase n=1 Tax=Stenotrophomonas koreensis TaxID=266128 RepID=UPI00339AE5C4
MDNSTTIEPRWGNIARERKAMAILRTIAIKSGKDFSGGTWIDIGCGSGGIAKAIAPHVQKIIAIDPTPWPCWEASSQEQNNLSFLSAEFDGDQLPLAEGMADIVICNQVYEHTMAPAKLIRNIERVLKPSGICYFAGPNLLWPIEPHVSWPFVHWLPRDAAQRIMRLLGSKRADELDAWSKSYWQLASWFEKNGFESSDIVLERITAELEMQRHKKLAKITQRTPSIARNILTPFWPGFIFLLRKKHTGG